jgi:hypothetical protein
MLILKKFLFVELLVVQVKQRSERREFNLKLVVLNVRNVVKKVKELSKKSRLRYQGNELNLFEKNRRWQNRGSNFSDRHLYTA